MRDRRRPRRKVTSGTIHRCTDGFAAAEVSWSFSEGERSWVVSSVSVSILKINLLIVVVFNAKFRGEMWSGVRWRRTRVLVLS